VDPRNNGVIHLQSAATVSATRRIGSARHWVGCAHC